MVHNRFFFIAVFFILLAGPYPARAERVEPNPATLSQVKQKRVLIIDDKNWNNHHGVPKEETLKVLKSIGALIGFASFDVMEDASIITLTDLNNYDIVIFNFIENLYKAVGTDFEAALKEWFAAGNRGYMGYHTSGEFGEGSNNEIKDKTLDKWPWYQDSVLAMRMTVSTAPHATGLIKRTEDPEILSLPIMDGLPTISDHTKKGDEWISFDLPPHPNAAPLWVDCKVLYNLDESTCDNKLTAKMGDIHPVMWIREDARKNRFFFSGQFHSTYTISVLSDFWNNMLLRALEYVAGERATSIPANENASQPSNGLSYAAKSRQLTVDLDGSYRLSVLAPDGQRLFFTRGEGIKAFAPPAFEKEGIYFVHLESKAKSLFQRVLIY